MRTTMKSTILWEENKMKILEDYKKIAHGLLFEEKEIDDEKMIKYKDKDGESKEMKAGSAKAMPMYHPAKVAYEKERGFYKMGDAGDDSGAEKEKGQKIGGSDFDRDGGDAKSSEPKAGGGDDSGDSDDEENYSVRLSMEIDDAVKSGKLPDGVHQKTKLEDIDEDALEDFYGELTYEIAKEYDITQEIFADDEMYHLDDIADKGGTLKDMYDSVISSAEEYAEDEGTRKFDENKKPKKKPFLREQLERFGGGHK